MIRLFNHHLSLRTLLLALIEGTLLFLSVVFGLQLDEPGRVIARPYLDGLLFAAVMLVAMLGLGLYPAGAEPFRTTALRVLVAYAVSLLLIVLLFTVMPALLLGQEVMVWISALALLSILAVRWTVQGITDLGLPKRRILVVGNGPEAESVVALLEDRQGRRNIEFAGYFRAQPDERVRLAESPSPLRGLSRLVRQQQVSEIVVATRERRGGVLPLRELLDARLSGVQVMDTETFFERESGILRLDNLRASWMIYGSGFRQSLLRDAVKRLFDVTVSCALLLLSLPLILGAMLAIYLESGKPIFYTQERVGRGGHSFRIIKLRSMRQDAEADGKARWATVNDSRITRVGLFLRKSRIDELPQLWSVLKGDMSFVGPRPERPVFVKQLIAEVPFYDIRHSIKPGVTGWAQVRHPYGSTIADSMKKLEFDLYYVKNHSLFLDLVILLETVQVVLLGKGAR
jgi:sugar transferase (PEP-CTERM system associated)